MYCRRDWQPIISGHTPPAFKMPGTFEPEFESKFLAFWAEVRREGDFKKKHTTNTFKSNNYNAVVNAEDLGKFWNIEVFE